MTNDQRMPNAQSPSGADDCPCGGFVRALGIGPSSFLGHWSLAAEWDLRPVGLCGEQGPRGLAIHIGPPQRVEIFCSVTTEPRRKPRTRAALPPLRAISRNPLEPATATGLPGP